MIEFSQAEIRELISIVRAEIDDLNNIDLPQPPELQSALEKLKAALVKPTPTADLFGIEVEP